MKKNPIFLLLSTALLFASCAKEYGYYEYTHLNMSLDLRGALGNFEEVNEDDFLPTKDQRIRVQFFIYDAAGKLVSRQEEVATDYYTTVSCKLERLELGDYTLIASTDLLDKSEGAFLPSYWEFTGTSKLNDFTVKGLDALDEMGERLLSLTREEFTINGRRKSKSLYLKAEPVTAMMCVTYYDIFYWDDHKEVRDPDVRIYSYFDVNYDHDKNEVRYAREQIGLPWKFYETTTDKFYILDRIYPDKLSGQGISSIYGYHALLPGKYGFYGYGEYSFKGEKEIHPDETKSTVEMNVEPGNQYYIDFDIANWTISLEDSYRTRAEGNVRNSQSIRAIDIPAHNELENSCRTAERKRR